MCGLWLQAVRKGNYPVVATNHTLILNWNSQTVPLLRQIAINKKEQGGPAYAGYRPIFACAVSLPALPHHFTHPCWLVYGDKTMEGVRGKGGGQRGHKLLRLAKCTVRVDG